MAALFFNFREIELSEALGSVGELKGAIANTLQESGFTDVVHTESEVAGNRNGVRVSILHLFVGGRSFWQVFMAGGDDGTVTLATLNEVVDKVHKLVFL